MALNESVLAAELEALFEMMETETMSNRDYAVKLAKAITDHIKTAEVPANQVVVSVTGQATGIKNPAGITLV